MSGIARPALPFWPVRHPLATAIGMVLATAATPVFAATPATDEPHRLGKVAVQAEEEGSDIKIDKASSPKQTLPLLDTPQTVTVVTKEVLQQQGAKTLMEALHNTPGITMQLGENGSTAAGDTFSLRGSASQTNIFVDGIRDLGAVTRDVFNLEQVEIVKGPAGADFGRGATAGYVNLVSKVPSLERLTSATASWDTTNSKRLTTDMNAPLGEHTALRVNVMGQDGGIAGRDVLNNRSWGVAPAFAAGLDTETRIYVYAQHMQQHNIPDGGLPTIGLNGFHHPVLAAANIQPPSVDRDNYYGRQYDFEKVRADMFTVRLEHDFGEGITLRNISRYGKSKMERILTGIGYNRNAQSLALVKPLTDPDDPNPDNFNVNDPDPEHWRMQRTRQGLFQENEILTNQTNVTANFATGSLEHSLSSGVEFINEKQDTPTYTGLGTLTPANLYHPDRSDAFTDVYDPHPSGAYSRGSTVTAAAYLFDALRFNKHWTVSAGGRIEHYNTDFSQVTLSTTATQPSLPANTPIPTTLSKDGNLFSWKLGVIYKPVENGSVYVSYANSWTPPGSSNFNLNTTISNGTNVNINNPNLDPQQATNIELGTKWDLLNAKLGLSFAVYRSENKNFIATADPATNTVAQFGKQRVDGVELGVIGNITAAWQLILGLAYSDAEVAQGSTGNNATGASIRWLAPFSATLWTTYRVIPALQLGAGARYMGTQKRVVDPSIDITTLPIPTIPSYTVADLMANYELSRHFSMQLNVYNVFDKFYINTLNNSGARYVPGASRSAQLSANVKF